MAVIINDFEIMVEPPTATGNGQSNRSQQESTPPPAQKLSPQDIERIVRHFEERRSRLNAD